MRPQRSRRVIFECFCGVARHVLTRRAALCTGRSVARRPQARSGWRHVALLAAAALVGTTLALTLRLEALPHTRAPAVSARATSGDAAGHDASAPPSFPAAATVGASFLRRAGAFAADHSLMHLVRASPAHAAEQAVRRSARRRLRSVALRRAPPAPQFLRLAAASAQPPGPDPSNRVAARAREAREAAATRRASRR